MILQFFITFFVLLAQFAQAETEVFEADKLRQRLFLNSYTTLDNLANLKIAVLDNGFEGYAAGKKLLPTQTEIVEQYPEDFIQRYQLSPGVKGNNFQGTRHGLSMAQTVWAVAGKKVLGPKFYLLNSNGLTNFRRAVRYAIEKQVDVILFSQNWEFGGNFDGKGFINQVVSQATQAKILWVNAAGNYGTSVYNSLLRFNEQNKATFTNNSTYLNWSNKLDENSVTITVSWNDFSETEEYQSQQDLDFDILDSNNTVVASGNKAQVNIPGSNRASTLHARERVTVALDRGTYKIQIKKMAGTFNAQSRVRVTILSEKMNGSIDFTDKSADKEMMIPADHPEVITVGDASEFSAKGPTLDGRTKPDLIIDNSEVRFTNGLITSGTSNAAALFAGILLNLKAVRGTLNRELVLKIIKSGGSCLYNTTESIEPLVLNILQNYAAADRDKIVVTKTREGRKVVLLPFEPIELNPYFNSTRAHAERYSLQSTDYKYFLARSLSSSQFVDSYYHLKKYQLDLPNDSDAYGKKRWIELKAKAWGDRICSGSPDDTSTPSEALSWKTPSPEELKKF